MMNRAIRIHPQTEIKYYENKYWMIKNELVILEKSVIRMKKGLTGTRSGYLATISRDSSSLCSAHKWNKIGFNKSTLNKR